MATMTRRTEMILFPNRETKCALILILLSSFLIGRSDHFAAAERIPVGAIFEQGSTHTQTAFKYALTVRNRATEDRKFELQAFVDVINTADAFKLSRIICNHFARGVFTMVGAVSPESFDTFHSYSNTFQMPFITPWFPEKMVSTMMDFATSMRPDFHRAVIDTIAYYGWKNIIYFYHSYEGDYSSGWNWYSSIMHPRLLCVINEWGNRPVNDENKSRLP